MEKVRDALVGEYEAGLEEVAQMAIGSEEHKIASETVLKYADRITKMEEVKLDREMREKQLKAENWDKIAKHSIDVLKFGVGLGATFVVYQGAMMFEEKGRMPTTAAGRKVLDVFFKNFKF